MEKHIQHVIGDRVRALRIRAGLSHIELAERLGWARTAIYAAENGERAYTASDFVLLAYVLHVTPYSLLLIPNDVKTVLVGSEKRQRSIPTDSVQHPSGTFDPDDAAARVIEIASLAKFTRDEAEPIADELNRMFNGIVALRDRIRGLAGSADDIDTLAMQLRVQQTQYTQGSQTQVVSDGEEEGTNE